MSYKAVFGHERQIAILQNAIRRERVAHAYLFHGMDGIGKRTIAFHFAKALLCQNPDTNGSCDACPTCLKVDHGNHPDVVSIAADGAFIKVQAVKDMISAMAFRPLEGGKRIFILAEAEKMNTTAANALLKTLEEPSASNILLLTTSRPHQLPITILSRCQHLRFQPLSREQVGRFLQERLSLDDETANALAASSGGSISRAVELNQAAYLKVRNDLMDYLAAGREDTPLNRLFFANFIGQDKKHLDDRLEVLKTCFRDALVYRELGNGSILINTDREDTIKALAGRSTPQEMVRNLRIMDRLTRALEQNANKTLTLEAAVFKLAL